MRVPVRRPRGAKSRAWPPSAWKRLGGRSSSTWSSGLLCGVHATTAKGEGCLLGQEARVALVVCEAKHNQDTTGPLGLCVTRFMEETDYEKKSKKPPCWIIKKSLRCIVTMQMGGQEPWPQVRESVGPGCTAVGHWGRGHTQLLPLQTPGCPPASASYWSHGSRKGREQVRRQRAKTQGLCPP